MAFNAEIRSRCRRHLSVRTVARIAIEAVRPEHLVRVGDFFQLACLGVAAIANVRLVDRPLIGVTKPIMGEVVFGQQDSAIATDQTQAEFIIGCRLTHLPMGGDAQQIAAL